MRRGTVVGAVIGLILVIGCWGLVRGIHVSVKRFTLPSVVVDADLSPDGSLRVVEHITYDFHGDFHYGTRPIPAGAYTITDLTVSEDGRPLQVVGAPDDTTFFFDAHDERRTFDVSYTVLAGVPIGPDVAEVYWKWVGDQHPTIGRVTATLHVPPGAGRVRAWGHGDLHGRVAIDGDTVTWTAPRVPTGTFVEGRVTVPASRFDAPTTALPILPGVLVEERAWAQAANAQRAADAEARRSQDRRRDLARTGVPAVIALGLAVFVVLWRQFGREPKVDDVGEYVRDLPDDPPAVVQALLAWGSVGASSFGATLVDLAQRGFLTISERTDDDDRRGNDFTYHEVTPAPAGELRPYEAMLLRRLFADGPDTTQSAVIAAARQSPKTAQRWWKDYRTAIVTDFRSRAYQRGDRGPIFLANLAAAALVGGAAWFASSAGTWALGTVALVAALAIAAGTLLLRQRTPAGARRAAEWRGVRRFLHDFSALADAPAGHLVLYERYLVYAVALDVAAPLARAMAVQVPDAVQQTQRWYVAPTGAGPDFGALAASLGTFGTRFSTAATPASSGSGFSGGGFSGGGGGGGGGGGIGAG